MNFTPLLYISYISVFILLRQQRLLNFLLKISRFAYSIDIDYRDHFSIFFSMFYVTSVKSVIYTEIIFSPFSVPRMSSRFCARRSSYSCCIMQRIVLQIQSSFGYFYRRQPRQRRETRYFYAV